MIGNGKQTEEASIGTNGSVTYATTILIKGRPFAHIVERTCEENSMDELISRQAAIDIVLEYAKRLYKPVGTPEDNGMYSYGRGLLLSIERNLKGLPTAEPKRGKWIEDKGQQTLMQNFIERGEVWRVCSVCGAGHMIGHKYAIDKAYHDRHHNFCPHCGADMRRRT